MQYIPQAFLLEILAQLSGIAVAEREGEGGFLATVDHAIFGRLPEPGDTLEVSARIVKSFGRLCMVQGTVTVRDEELLNATLTLGIGKL
jgi:3-hydroxyacyl-[acyl-carrier-protein] dehydratase